MVPGAHLPCRQHTLPPRSPHKAPHPSLPPLQAYDTVSLPNQGGVGGRGKGRQPVLLVACKWRLLQRPVQTVLFWTEPTGLLPPPLPINAFLSLQNSKTTLVLFWQPCCFLLLGRRHFVFKGRGRGFGPRVGGAKLTRLSGCIHTRSAPKSTQILGLDWVLPRSLFGLASAVRLVPAAPGFGSRLWTGCECSPGCGFWCWCTGWSR